MKTVGLHGAKLVLREEQLASGFIESMELRQEAVTVPGGGGGAGAVPCDCRINVESQPH